MRMKKLLTFLTLLTLFFTTAWAETGTIYFGSANGRTNINKTTVTGQDNLNNTWTITTVGTTSFTPNSVYNQVGSANKPATSITFTTTLPNDVDVTSMQAKFGGFSGTAGTITLKVGDTSIGTGSLNGSNDVTVTSTSTASGKVLTVTVTNISKGVKCYFISYEYTTGGTSSAAAPTFSPAAGTYYEPVNVTLSTTTPDAVIRYTTDGNDPDNSSAEYNGPITVNETMTIKAIATATGYDPSSVATATYTIFEPETVTPTYEQSLISGFGKFYYVDKTNPTTSAIWKSNNYGAVASGQISGTKYNTESWLYTPYIDLTNATNPELSFSHAGNYFTDVAAMQSDVQVMVRQLNGTNWSDWSVLTINTWPTGADWNFVDNTTSLSTYAGKTIQIAFKYTSSTSRAGSWEIKNFKVQNTNPSAPKYYLVGSFNGWTAGDEDYQFEESNGTYTLDNVNFPDANTTFKIVTPNGDNWTWYGGTGNEDYVLHHRHHTNIPMDGSQNYKIQSAGVTSFSFTLDNNTPTNLNVNRTASLAIKGAFTDNWTEVPMTATADGWTTTQTVAVNDEFGFVDEFGQYIDILWTVGTEHLGTNIPMTTDGGYQVGNYKMGIAGTYQFTANNDLTTLVITAITGETYTLVTSASELDETSDFIIVSKDFGYAMSTEQRTANRGATAITLTNNGASAVASADTQVFKLEEDENGGWYFNTGSGYIYASSSSKNELKTQATKTNNAKAAISFTDGETSIIFQGDYTRNDLRFNNDNDPKIFSCYASTSTMAKVSLYKKGGSTTPKSDDPVITPASQDVKGGLLEDVTITAAEGATIYYTTDGTDPSEEDNTNRVQYTEPFDIQVAQGGPQTVKAIAIETGKDPSNVVSVQYTFKNPDAPTFTPDPAVVQTGDFNITINSADGGVIYYVLDPDANEIPSNSQEVIDANNVYADGVAVTGTGEHKIYAAVVLNGLKSTLSTATYTVVETGAEGDWTLVTSTDDIQSGRDYIIVNSDRDRTVGEFNPTLTSGNFSSIDCENNVVFGPDFNTATVAGSNVTIFTVEEENGNLYMKSGDTYYVPSTTETYINTGKNPVYFSMNGGFVAIKGSADADRSFAYNYQSSMRYFASYKNPTTTGNQRPVYMYYRGADSTPRLTLAELCATGEQDHEYVISDMLKVAYVDPSRGLAWCKDLGDKSIVKTSIHEDEQIDFMNNAKITGETGQNGRDWDQSNWILLQFTAPNGSNGIDEMLKNADRKLVKPGTIKGKLVDNKNYILKMNEDHLELLTQADEGYDETPYQANVYCPSNFLPENLNIWGSIEAGDGAYSGNNTQNYFFMNPKIQEVCYITYAQWNALGYFTVPSNSGIKGGFQVGWAYNNYNGTPSLHDGTVYKFHAIVNRNDKEYGPNNPISAKDELPFSEHITVLPIDLTGDDNIITAINTVSANGEVKSVKYVNVAGIVSDTPFQGVNIVVTEYTDGSRTTSKMLRK